jgi:hypothetical protein
MALTKLLLEVWRSHPPEQVFMQAIAEQILGVSKRIPYFSLFAISQLLFLCKEKKRENKNERRKTGILLQT